MKTTVEIDLIDAFGNLSYNEAIEFLTECFDGLSNIDQSNFIQERLHLLDKDDLEEALKNLN